MSKHAVPKKQLPEWAPECGGDAFASVVMEGVTGGHDGLPQTIQTKLLPTRKRHHLGLQDYVSGIEAGDRVILARAITLVESNLPTHLELSQEVLRRVLPRTGRSIRIGITGVPGAGKSTFIETLGCYLVEKGHRVAVLAVDPSSTLTKGSILGDKTRMAKLSREPRCFIRPSPSGGTLGGVNRKTRETMLLCEAADYDVILVETVGVGQSEVTVRSMVDFFLLVLIAGAGDELQGIKKGIIELADAILVNKSDGDNRIPAQVAREEYARALHYLAQATEGWTTPAATCSALTGEGIPETWQTIQDFVETTQASGIFAARRRAQTLTWTFDMVEEYLRDHFYRHPDIQKRLPSLKTEVLDGHLPPTRAAQELLGIFQANSKSIG